MSEMGPGPNPDDIESDGDNELTQSSDNELVKQALDLEEVDVNDPDTNLQLGPILETMPKAPPGEFLPDEVVVGPDGREYTTAGLLKEKVIKREQYLSEHAQQLVSLRVGDLSFARGMLVVANPKVASEVLAVTDVHLEKDEQFDKGQRRTGVVVSCAGNDGALKEFRPGDNYPVPLYSLPAKQKPAIVDQDGGHKFTEIEHQGVKWQVGEYFCLNAEPSYIGRIALIPGDSFPGQVGVMLRDRTSASELYLINLDDISKPA